MVDSKVPEVIGGYELVRPLGRGGMAEVWLARKGVGEKGSKYVALKLIAEHFVRDERYARMFRAEAELAAVLNHANIVQVFDDGVQDGRSYLVMEWVDGLNLLKLGEKLTHVDEPRRFRLIAYIIGQLLHALHYAHCIRTADGHPLGVVHRDVSPQNVLISINGEVKLTDFGVAHHNFEESSGMYVKGKVRYMAPEQLSGQSRSPSVDLYAVGALLHELIDGQKFRGAYEDGQDLLTVVWSGHVPPLSRPAPPELDGLRARLLEQDPTRRVQSAEEALALLERYPGYGDAREELRKLCGNATGVVHPRVGPGQSSPANAAEPVTAARRPALAKPKVEPAPQRPPAPATEGRRPTLSLTALKTAVKRRAPAGAWITGQTQCLPPPSVASVPTWPGPRDPSAQPPTERLAPTIGLRSLPVATSAEERGSSLEDRWSSATENDVVAPAVVDDGTTTQHDRRPRPPAPARSQGAAPSRRWAFALLGVLPLLLAGSSMTTWWIFDRAHGNDAASTAASAAWVEPKPWSLASLLQPAAAASGASPSATTHEAPVTIAPTASPSTTAAMTADGSPGPEDATNPVVTPGQSQRQAPVKAPVRKAMVKVVASSGLEAAEVKVGTQRFAADEAAHKITAGTQPIRWRRAPSEPWQAAGRWSFKPGKLSVIHVSRKGPKIRLAEGTR